MRVRVVDHHSPPPLGAELAGMAVCLRRRALAADAYELVTATRLWGSEASHTVTRGFPCQLGMIS